MSPRAAIGFVLRESRGSRGRLLFFTACIAIGVAAVVGVAALSGSLDDGLRARSRELLGADLKVESRRPLPPELDEFFADRPGVRRADVRELATMAAVPGPGGQAERSRLVELKVVEGGYPFYGGVELEPPGRLEELLLADTAVVAPELLSTLQVEVGDELLLGGARFEIAGVVHDEPDRLAFALTLGPRVFLSAAGLERTALTGFGNRVRIRALFRLPGDPDAAELEALEEELEEFLPEAGRVRIETHAEAQPSVRRGLRRFTSFLGLVALMSLVLGGIGVAQVVRTWIASRTTGIAVLRCIGLVPREILVLYMGHVLALAFVGSLAGALLGGALAYALPSAAPELLPREIVQPFQPAALGRGLGLGVGVAFLFSLPALTALWRVPPALVLRSVAGPLRPPRGLFLGTSLALVLGLFGAAFVQAGRFDRAAWFTGGLLVVGLVLALGARGVSWLVRRLPRHRLPPALVHGCASLARPGAGTVGAIVALGLGCLVVSAMTLIERRLEDELRGALPEDAPSTFLVDVQPEQWPGVRTLLEESGATGIDSVPVVMARLAAIDGRAVSELLEDRRRDEGERGRRRASWVLTREQRLTWLDELPEENRIVAGSLWSDPAADEVSVEEGYAEDLDVGVGSTLTFDVQGVPFELAVTSVRTVEWETFAINFFLVVEPGVIDDAPGYRIAAARVAETREDELQNRLVAGFPNVTMMRLRPLLAKVAAFLENMALGIRILGAFTVLAGVAILAGSVAATQMHRAREVALWKTLGVTRRGVVALFASEFALVGLVAGGLGGLGAQALAYGFLEHVLELAAELPLGGPLATALAGALLATVAGVAASARALAARPVESLR